MLALLTMYGLDTGIRTERFFDLSRLVMQLAGVSQPSNRPVVGERLYNVESGIITTWVRNVGDELTESFPYRPELVGQPAPGSCWARVRGSTRSPRGSTSTAARPRRSRCEAILAEVKERSLADEGSARRRAVPRRSSTTSSPADELERGGSR